MPIPFKNRALGTDAGVMSDTVVNDTHQTTPDPAFFLDGDAPRLGETAAPAPAPAERPTPMLDMEGRVDIAESAPNLPTPTPLAATEDLPALPVVSPVLTSPDAPTLPAGTPNHVPMSTEAPVVEDLDEDGEPRHPMAHLMPGKSAPSEASRRAAEIRAAQKAKGKKIKIGIAVGSLVFTALVGPPLFSWLSDALDEAGNTSTEQIAD